MKNYPSRDPLELFRNAPLESRSSPMDSRPAEKRRVERRRSAASGVGTITTAASPRGTEDGFAWPNGMPYSYLQ